MLWTERRFPTKVREAYQSQPFLYESFSLRLAQNKIREQSLPKEATPANDTQAAATAAMQFG